MKKGDKLAIIYFVVAIVFIFLYIMERQSFHLAIGACFMCLAAVMKNKSNKGD